MVLPNEGKETLIGGLKGIQHSRRWITKLVYEEQDLLPLNKVDNDTIITDYCVKPG